MTIGTSAITRPVVNASERIHSNFVITRLKLQFPNIVWLALVMLGRPSPSRHQPESLDG